MLINANRLLSVLNKKLQTYSNECKMPLEDASFLLSLSGGMDSTIMASLILEVRNKYDFKLGFAHINHNVHMKSKQVEKFCSQYSRKNNVVFHVHQLFFDSKQNFEACARDGRYKFLNIIANKYSYNFILTAHHQDDQLETVFMKSMDCGDWISCIGIRERFGKLRRPFLGINKIDIKLYAKEFHIPWVEDPSNADMAIRRNYIRQTQLPQALLENPLLKNSLLNSSIANSLKLKNTLIRLKQDQSDIIKKHSQNYLQINRKSLIKYNLEELKLFIYKSVASLMKIELGQQSGGIWRSFKNFINKSNTGTKFQINTLTFIINRDDILVLDSLDNIKAPEKLRLYGNLEWFEGNFITNHFNSIYSASPKDRLIMPQSLYKNGIYIRKWIHGDRMISATSKQHILLSDLYINNKLSKYEKIIQPVVVDDSDKILWVPGLLHGLINYNINDQVEVLCWVKR